MSQAKVHKTSFQEYALVVNGIHCGEIVAESEEQAIKYWSQITGIEEEVITAEKHYLVDCESRRKPC